MLKNQKTKLNIFIFLIIILFISTGCVFNNGKKIKTSNNNPKVIQKNNKTNNKTKPQEQISSSTIKEDLNQKDNKQLVASTTETKDLDISNWQTYRNEEYGFEIKYPRGWKINKFKTACVGLVDCSIDCQEKSKECDVLGITFYHNITKHNRRSVESVSIKIVPNRLRYIIENMNKEKNSQWFGPGMFSGCYISALRFVNNIPILFESFVEATDLNNIQTTEKEKKICERGVVNLFFDKILLSFRSF